MFFGLVVLALFWIAVWSWRAHDWWVARQETRDVERNIERLWPRRY